MKRFGMLVLTACLLAGLAGCGEAQETQALPNTSEIPSLSPSASAEIAPTQPELSAETSEPPPSPTAQPFYAKVGDYIQDSDYGGTNEIYIQSISADHSTVTLNGDWHRYIGFQDVVATLDGNVATFDTGVQQGKIEFQENSLILTFLTEPLNDQYGFDTFTPMQFDYFTQEELEQQYADGNAWILLNNNDGWGWIHSSVDPSNDLFAKYCPVYLRFFPDGTVKCWLITPDGVTDIIDIQQCSYRVGYNRLWVNDAEYEMVVGEGAAWHLYLTAVGDDPLGLNGSYELGDDGFYSSFQRH